MVFVPVKKKNSIGPFRLGSSGRRQRFPLAEYNRVKKERTQALIECDAKISSLRSQLHEKTTELEALKSKLHNTEERIRRGKRKVIVHFILFIIVARL